MTDPMARIVALILACTASTAVAQGPGPNGRAGGSDGGKIITTDDFALVMCNKSKDLVAFVAAGARVVDADNKTRVQGWWQVSQGQCVQIGTFPQPGFVFYARSSYGTAWSGNPPFTLCVDLKDRFDETVSTASEIKQCPANQTLVGFSFIEVKPGQRIYTMNLN